ncbi:MAG: hydrogenase accessory protein HypB, partial [Hungatella sp.]|jgi:hydrogenase nickel incorporation protein HypB|nr:hydrogenase accessory protein HypB [Hungatella sp.]
MPYFNFDMEKCKANIRLRNPNAIIIPISALKDEGIKEWTDWLSNEVKSWCE